MHPGLSEVRAAMEAQDDELAAVALRAKLAEAGAFEKDCPRCHYLLGVIEERRSATAQAIVAFENAAQSDWLLRKDALLHLVRLELQRSNCPRVKDLLDQVGVANGQGGTTATHAAQLEICQRNWQAATARLRQLVADDKSDTRRASHRLLLAETLTEQDQARSGDRRTGDDEVAKLLVEILSTEGAEPEILAKARAMLDRILLRNAKKSGVDQQLAERVALLEATVEARRWEEGRPLAEELTSLAWSEPNLKTLRCRVWLAHGRLAAAVGDRGAAIEKLNWVVDSCNDIDQAARALFLEAAQIASLGKRPEAIAKYAQLEQRFAAHRLADDARLKQANLYRAMEADSRFVALLDAMPNDYPNGDMVLEGLFQLALKDMQERNWSRALSVLERAERFARTLERPKDADVDRQKYFLGCINLVQGQRSAGIELLRELVSDRPLSYYMLLAYSVLARHAPDEARRVLEAVQSNTPPEPQRANSLSAEHQGQLERIVALLGVGDVAAADELMQEAGAQRFGDFATSSVAAMYADAGATKTALGLMKRMGRGWQAHWPTGGWSELWKVAYPRPYREMVQRESKRTGVDESLIYAIMREESEFDPKAVSQAEAFGLMQVILPTARSAARELGIKVDPRALKKPGVNIAVGSRVLSKLNERFSGQLALIAAGYNAGPGRPVRWLRKYPEMDLDLWIELIEYPETRGYVKRVLSSAAAYRWLYAASGGAEESILRLPARPGPGQ